MLLDRRPSPAVLMVLGSCTSLQLGAVLATPLLQSLGPGLTTAVRLLLAASLLLLVHRPGVGRWDRAQWRSVLLFGVAMAGMNGFFYAAIARIPLGLAVTIEFAGPLVLAAVLSRRLRDLVCVVAAAGAIVVLGLDGHGAQGTLDPIGVAFALVAAAFWAAYILAGKQVGARVPGHGALAVGMLVSALVVAPFGAAAVPALVADPAQLLPLAGVALLSSFVPYSLEFQALRRLPSRVFGVLLALEPVVAGVAGWVLLGQSLTIVHVVAMLVVVGASVVTTLGGGESPASEGTGGPAPVTAELAVVPERAPGLVSRAGFVSRAWVVSRALFVSRAWQRAVRASSVRRRTRPPRARRAGRARADGRPGSR